MQCTDLRQVCLFYLDKAMEIYVSYIYMNGYVCNQTVDFGKLWNTTIKLL